MGKITYDNDSQRKIEVFVLSVYTIYATYMIMAVLRRGWESWIGYVFIAGTFLSWIICVSKCKDYVFRAKFSAVIMQISIVIFTLCSDGITNVLPVFAAFVVFNGLYGISNIINYTFFSTVIIFFAHSVIIKDIPLGTTDELLLFLSQIGNMLLLEYIMYIWVKRNRDGSKKLLEVIEELKEVESKKDDFLANVSHEIRTPINTICGISEIILCKELTQELKDDVLRIQLAGRNLMMAVSDVLDFSELQSGTMELANEAYNITSTINDVISMATARKGDKNLELIVDCDATLPCILLGDEKKIRRVIMNLVDNAIKFTEEGYVSISIGYRRESYGINLSVTVKDSGIGMDDESLEMMFASFNQVDSSRRRQEGGLGLGLAISHALVQKMGGAITVKSKFGKGSSFRVVIPQKVLEETPLASIDNKNEINVAVYIDMEQFGMVAIRDEYSKSIIHMVEQLKGKCHICRNLAELQRREELQDFSHVFISVVEYRQSKPYFDELAERTQLVVVLDRFDEKYITNKNILKIIKPFYIQTIVAVLNGLYDISEQKNGMGSNFITSNVHVLVVDDNRMNIRVIDGLLANYKIKVTVATSGKEALEKILTANYDFLFMDHMMPEMDGVETMHRIRNMVGSYYQNVPIVALTANAVAGTRELMLKEGFDDFLEKPIERSVLERVLKRQIVPEKIVEKQEIDTETLKIDDKGTKTDDLRSLESLGVLGIDVSKGTLYCNGEENYISILKGYCEDYKEIGGLCEELFEKEDWENYTISVHGIKGALRSIGSDRVSEIAAGLERAGKEKDVEYISKHHSELMEEFNGLFLKLSKHALLATEMLTDEKDYVSIGDEEFDAVLAEMEIAMYALDEAKLRENIEKLQKCSYCGTPLNESLKHAIRKVEMSDYVSAVELVVRLKKKISDKG